MYLIANALPLQEKLYDLLLSEKSFEKKYLRDIYKDIKDLKSKIEKIETSDEFKNELRNQLDLAFLMIKNAAKNDIEFSICDSKEKSSEEKQFAYAYISLYMIIEIITNYYVIKTSDNQWQIRDLGFVNNLTWINNAYSHSDTPIEGYKIPEWKKFAGLYFQKWLKKDSSFVRNIYFSIEKRNYFIHNDDKLDYLNGADIYPNHDIFEPKGFINLFKLIKQIIMYL